MARFIIRSISSAVITMLLVSMVLFFLVEVGSGDITVKILGIESTAGAARLLSQPTGTEPPRGIALSGLAGRQRLASDQTRRPSAGDHSQPQTKELEWWAKVGDEYLRWKMQDGELIALVRQPDGSLVRRPAGDVWFTTADGTEQFLGSQHG